MTRDNPGAWKKLISVCLMILAAGLLTGCVAVPGAPAATPDSAQEDTMRKKKQPTPTQESLPTPNPPAARPVPTHTATPRSSGVSDIVLQTVARQDLGRRLGIPAREIKVAHVARSEMPAGSLGCGEAGDPQNIGTIIGIEITLSVGDQDYVYRSDGVQLAPCSPADFPGGTQPTYVSGGLLRPASSPQESARTDLAGQLGIAVDAITVRSVEVVEWSDASLGCTRPGQLYAQVITPGYRIVLEAGGKSYEYHAGNGRVIRCTP